MVILDKQRISAHISMSSDVTCISHPIAKTTCELEMNEEEPYLQPVKTIASKVRATPG